jgi:hypothetical protein
MSRRGRFEGKEGDPSFVTADDLDRGLRITARDGTEVAVFGGAVHVSPGRSYQ